jgi:Protein of Unknown function (DUF2784)
LFAQGTGSLPEVSQQAAAALTGDQQSAANSALCSAIGSHFPNPASAGPSALSDPAVMSAAASRFAGSTHLPLSGATDLLKGYVAQHATEIFASCAASNTTGGLPLKLPGAGSLPSIPKMPSAGRQPDRWEPMFAFSVLADLVVLVHALYVGFVVMGVALISAGGIFGWTWIRNFWLRVAHLAAIAAVCIEALTNTKCPLTTFERSLRQRAGG